MRSEFDVLVVGGGIVGASAGHHLASAGYDTLLVEQSDYASGTSSRTSRMHNCGFMYFLDAYDSVPRFLMQPRLVLRSLELARRTMRERAEFALSSPDRVRKFDFLIPLSSRGGLTKPRVALGAKLLQILGGNDLSLEPKFLDAEEARAHPLLRLTRDQADVTGAFRFAEYQYVWPERIVIDTIQKSRAAGLDARNYTRLVGLAKDPRGWMATLEHRGGTETVLARAVVNAAGAWVDIVTHLASPDAPLLNTGAKGVNLLVRLPQALRGHGMELVTDRGTPFYVMPWGDLHYIGPADRPSEATESGYRATEEEIAQILADAAQLAPGLKLGRADVIYSWAGVRPRTAADGEPMGSLEVREHDLSDRGLPNFFVFTGGLIMTHRDAGRPLLRAVRRHLKPSRPARDIDYHLERQPDEDRVTARSVRRAIEEEQALSLSDILRRRLSVGWDADLGVAHADAASRLAAEVLGWSEEERRTQVSAYRTEIERSFGWTGREAEPHPEPELVRVSR